MFQFISVNKKAYLNNVSVSDPYGSYSRMTQVDFFVGNMLMHKIL